MKDDDTRLAAGSDIGSGRLSATVALLTLIAVHSSLPLLLGSPSPAVSSAGMWMSDAYKWGVTALLLLTVIFWEGRGLGSVGLRRPRLAEIGIGLAAGAAWVLLSEGAELAFDLSLGGSTLEGLRALGPVQLSSVVATAAVTEEVVFRGVLMVRVEELTGRAWPAVAATVLLFVGSHVAHFGLATNVAQTLVTLLLALLFLWRRDLTAPVVVHAVIDGWGLLLAPALGL